MAEVACAILVMAKAPVAGQAKTRLASVFGPTLAADLAAALLLDTLVSAQSARVTTRIVALAGDLSQARRGTEIASMLGEFAVVPQRGTDFVARLMEAHVDAGAVAGVPVLQIGMDTPQASADILTAAAATLVQPEVDAVLGKAQDGGWWALGLSDPGTASVLEGVAMSRADTGSMTLAALVTLGCIVTELPVLSDVDTPDDVWLVAKGLDASSHFRQAVEQAAASGLR